MRVSIRFDHRDDLASTRDMITGTCLTLEENKTVSWKGTLLEFKTRDWASAVLERFEDEGFSAVEFESISFHRE